MKTAPCGAASVLSCGCAALRGRGSQRRGPGHGFRPAPSAFRRPRGFLPAATFRAARGCAKALLCFRSASKAPAAAPSPAVGACADPSQRTLSPELRLPCDTIEGPGCKEARIHPRFAATCGVWLPPARPLAETLPARQAPERPWASAFRAFPPCRRGPSRGRCPPVVAGPRAAPEGARRSAAGFRALLSTRVRSVAVPCGPAVGALLAFPPPERSLPPSGRSALIARPPLLPHARADVTARQGFRVLRSGRRGWSVSGLPALLGFVTLRLSRRRVRRCRGLAHGFTSGRSSGLRRPPDRLHPLTFRLASKARARCPRPPSIGVRLATSSIRQNWSMKERAPRGTSHLVQRQGQLDPPVAGV